uniref:Uncharacterized protein n=1 Tax=Arundo donax TaxID=35708 RepID=A0A0A8ZRL4_ARUDO
MWQQGDVAIINYLVPYCFRVVAVLQKVLDCFFFTIAQGACLIVWPVLLC